VKGHGTGVLTRFASELGYSLTLKNYAAGVFASGVPNGYLKVTAPGLAQDKADALKSRWLAAHGGSSRSIAVLNATTEFHPLTFSPVDAALVEVVKEHRTELANAFGIPGTFIGAPSDNNTYANIESRRLDLNTFTFMPWSSRIEAVLDAQLPRGTSLKVDLNALARGDIPARIAYYAAGQAGGWLFRDEIRDFEDLPPITAAVEDEVAVA
jgi:HK97 family phage portal protein